MSATLIKDWIGISQQGKVTGCYDQIGGIKSWNIMIFIYRQWGKAHWATNKNLWIEAVHWARANSTTYPAAFHTHPKIPIKTNGDEKEKNESKYYCEACSRKWHQAAWIKFACLSVDIQSCKQWALTIKHRLQHHLATKYSCVVLKYINSQTMTRGNVIRVVALL